MRIIQIVVCFASVALLMACANSKKKNIPKLNGIHITTDGMFTEQAWGKAKQIEMNTYNKLLLFQTDSFLYVGVRNIEKIARYVDVYINSDSLGLLNLHASMQLGERKLEGNWNDTIPTWHWGNNNQWTANIVSVNTKKNNLPFLETINTYEGFEFKISKRKIGNTEIALRIEINDFMGEATSIIFPDGLLDYDLKNWYVVKF